MTGLVDCHMSGVTDSVQMSSVTGSVDCQMSSVIGSVDCQMSGVTGSVGCQV